MTLATASGRDWIVPTTANCGADLPIDELPSDELPSPELGGIDGCRIAFFVLSDSAAAWIAPMIAGYPAHRHSVSFSACRISISVGAGLHCNKAYAVIN
jgi:hypothetical protein